MGEGANFQQGGGGGEYPHIIWPLLIRNTSYNCMLLGVHVYIAVSILMVAVRAT